MMTCDLPALGQALPRYRELGRFVGQSVQDVGELPDGYALQLPATAEAFFGVAEWITLERQCCPFMDFALDWRSSQGPWLRLTGPDGVKAMIGAAFTRPLA
jgi:hypothetical protein